jgi:hypothetical protein
MTVIQSQTTSESVSPGGFTYFLENLRPDLYSRAAGIIQRRISMEWSLGESTWRGRHLRVLHLCTERVEGN